MNGKGWGYYPLFKGNNRGYSISVGTFSHHAKNWRAHIMDLTIAYQRWVITLKTPNTMRKYRECVGKFSRDMFGKEPWELTFEELQRVTRLDIRERFYLPMVSKGRAQTTIQSYFTPVRSYLNYLNEHHVFSEPINTEKFRWTGQVLPSKKQLISRVEKVEKELAELKQLLATYDYDNREIEA